MNSYMFSDGSFVDAETEEEAINRRSSRSSLIVNCWYGGKPKNKYAVVQKFYDSGRITAVVVEVDPNTISSHESKPTYDEYIDVFDSEQDAHEFFNMCVDESR